MRAEIETAEYQRFAPRPSDASAELAARWDHAVTLFRGAVDSYVRAVQLRRKTATRRISARHEPVRLPIGAGVVPEPVGALEPRSFEGLILTRRESEVASLIAKGQSNQQIAASLVIEQGTVANHVAHILRKLEVSNRTQIAAWFLANGSSTLREAPAAEQ